MHRWPFICLLLILLARAAAAGDAWVVRFNAMILPDCTGITWRDSTLVYNTNPLPAQLRIVGTSDDPPKILAPATVTAPPGRVVNLADLLQLGWLPELPALSVIHVDVPEGVTLSASDEFEIRNWCIGPPYVETLNGRTAMPVFDHLTPAGMPQVHMHTDLGDRLFASGVQTRTNVIVYNGGTAEATAHVQLRRVCDDSVTDERTETVAPNSTTQIVGLSAGENVWIPSCRPWERYAIVTVDQPSLSLVSNVRHSTFVFESSVAPTVDLNVPVSYPF